jgi:hypothetical protein
MRLHYPGVVSHPGFEPASAAVSWGDYGLATDINYENAQGVVWNDFWVFFFIIPTEFVFFIYLIVDFDFAETFPVGRQRRYGACESSLPQECKEDCYSINIRRPNCRIK